LVLELYDVGVGLLIVKDTLEVIVVAVRSGSWCCVTRDFVLSLSNAPVTEIRSCDYKIYTPKALPYS